MKNKLIIFFAVASLFACVTPLDVNIDRDEFLLVVEGRISTEAKEHEIKLTRSAKYGTIFEGVIRNVQGADVYIRDQEGNITELFETFPGKYVTPSDFKAEVGKTYILQINTLDGQEFMSRPETVVPAIGIEAIVPRFRKVPTSDPAVFTTGMEIYARYQDPEGEKNYYSWEIGGTHYFETSPQDFELREPFSPPTPAPKDCCAECWRTEEDIDNSIRIANDAFTDGNISTELAGFIEDNGLRFMDKYLVRVKQYSQSKEAHQFFSLLNEQINIDGDIFDAPPGQIRGNIYNVIDFDQPVIGYFWAGDVVTDSLFIESSSLEETQFRDIPDDCRVLFGATDERPDYWY